MEYNLDLITAPEIEPLSLTEIKKLLKLDINEPNTTLTNTKLIAPGLYTPQTITSASFDISGKVATIQLSVGVIVATGKLNVKIQESEDDITFTDYESFTQILTATDETNYSIQYAGYMKYIRVVAVIATANVNFGVSVTTNDGYIIEDDTLEAFISAARDYCENYQKLAYITQKWSLSLSYWPECSVIELPKGHLQSIVTIKYKDSAGVETTLVNNTDYVYSTKGMWGRITTPYGKMFPSFVPFPLDAITIEFICGYGDTGESVPPKVKQAMKLLIKYWYESQNPVDRTKSFPPKINETLKSLLAIDRVPNI
jgi:uncharacterized phiE125 gp8 family phage protein